MNIDYQEIAAKVVEVLGGKENILNISTCATRIRVRYKEISRVDTFALEAIQDEYGIPKGFFFCNNCLQMIIGTKVIHRFYQAMIDIVGDLPAEPDHAESAEPDNSDEIEQTAEAFTLALKILALLLNN